MPSLPGTHHIPAQNKASGAIDHAPVSPNNRPQFREFGGIREFGDSRLEFGDSHLGIR
jgi:hypothetical protein